MLTLALLTYVVVNGQNILAALLRLLAVPATLATMDFREALKIAASVCLREGLGLLWPFVLIVLGFGLFVEFGQIGLIFAAEKAKPSGTKLNVVSNVKNIF